MRNTLVWEIEGSSHEKGRALKFMDKTLVRLVDPNVPLQSAPLGWRNPCRQIPLALPVFFPTGSHTGVGHHMQLLQIVSFSKYVSSCYIPGIVPEALGKERKSSPLRGPHHAVDEAPQQHTQVLGRGPWRHALGVLGALSSPSANIFIVLPAWVPNFTPSPC